MSGSDEGVLAPRLSRFRDRYGVPAVGAAIVTTGAPPAIVTVGARVRGGAEPVTDGDRWHVGSCGKSMTAALVARLVERGTTAWDATLPELFGDLGGGMHPAWRQVTLSQVLLHRAGLPANLSRRELLAAQTDSRPVTEQRGAVAAGVLTRPPRRPGRFRYSNLGYIVVGAAVERLTGRSYEAALSDQVLHPLGITSAGFGAPDGADPWGHRPGALRIGRGPAVDPADTAGPHASDNPPVMSPAGRLHLDLGDWSRFVRLFIEPGGELLRPSSVATLTTLPPVKGAQQAMGWAVPTGRRWGSGRIAYGQQGSNRNWVATALVGAGRRSAALVACNDGRTRLLAASAMLAADLLDAYDR